MSKVGMITSVSVWFIVMLPNNSLIINLRYLPSYFGPVADALLIHKKIEFISTLVEYES